MSRANHFRTLEEKLSKKQMNPHGNDDKFRQHAAATPAAADIENPRHAQAARVELVPDGRRAVPFERAPAAYAAAAAALDRALLVAQSVR